MMYDARSGQGRIVLSYYAIWKFDVTYSTTYSQFGCCSLVTTLVSVCVQLVASMVYTTAALVSTVRYNNSGDRKPNTSSMHLVKF